LSEAGLGAAFFAEVVFLADDAVVLVAAIQ